MTHRRPLNIRFDVQNTETTPALRISSLAHRYASSGTPALQIDTLTLDPGEQVVLTGSSGSGKSTLLHLVAGLMEPSSGTIEIAGEDIHKLNGHARDRFRGRSVGMVFQTHHLLTGFSAEENVMAALIFSDIPRGSHRDRARTLLESLGIPTPSQRVERLSIGQQQRVVIARCLAQVTSPGVLLLDEPLAALDLRHASRILEIMRSRASDGDTVIVSLHDLGLAATVCDHVWLLSEGCLQASGDPGEVLTESRLEQVYGARFERLKRQDGRDWIIPSTA